MNNTEEGFPYSQPFVVRVVDEHFVNIIYFLTIRVAPTKYTIRHKKELVVRAANFSLINGHMYKMGSDEIFHRYVPEHERYNILVEVHGGAMGGNYIGKEIVQKVLRVGLWWPTVHKDSKDYCSAYDVFQRTRRPSRRDELSLNIQVTL